jgi:hypothetical protein
MNSSSLADMIDVRRVTCSQSVHGVLYGSMFGSMPVADLLLVVGYVGGGVEEMQDGG